MHDLSRTYSINLIHYECTIYQELTLLTSSTMNARFIKENI